MSRPKLVALDALLVERGLASSRVEAQALIEARRVRVDGLVATKAGTRVRTDRPLELGSGEHAWVGRGAHKLLGALAELPMAIDGHVCADLGASTGGFTEVLLHRGAARVFAVDVGQGLLHRRLELDPRVHVLDGVNVRHLEELPEPVGRIVGDLSFISLTRVLPVVARLLAPGAEALLLVKPQFEADREGISARGRVKDEAREEAVDRVRSAAESEGFALLGRADCVLPGARSGNVEHFLWLGRR